MSSIIQLLIHICELDLYFLNEYPKDSLVLKQKNKNNSTEGRISAAFYKLIKNIYKNMDEKYNNNSYNINNVIYLKYSNQNTFYLEEFKKEILVNFPKLENYFNDYKSSIQYLLQIMHEELNYFGDYQYNSNNKSPTQSNKLELYKEFNIINERSNYSIFTKLFYGTYICNSCNNITYNYQKFQFVSFDISSYDKKIFNILNGFEDNEKTELLNGENKVFCNKFNKKNDTENYRKII